MGSVVNLDEVGDLVPTLSDEHWPSRDMGPTYQEQLKEIVHETATVRHRWKWHPLPPSDGFQYLAFERTAYICAVQLSGGNWGVMRIDPETGDCFLFLRLERAHWFAWADEHKVQRSAMHVFSKCVDDAMGKAMLMDARGRTLGLWDVHHPHVLSVLCTMSKHGWLDCAAEQNETHDSPQRMGTFTLVALPPLPAEFEQCLWLLGHSATFVKDNAGSDDDDVSLSTRSDAKPVDKVWGTAMHGKLVKGPLAHHFEQGTREVCKYAAPFLFALGIDDFNKYARIQTRVLDDLRCAIDTYPLRSELVAERSQLCLDPSDNEEELEAVVAATAVATKGIARKKAVSFGPTQIIAPSPSPSPSPSSLPLKRQPKSKQRPRQETKKPAAQAYRHSHAKTSNSDSLSDSDSDDASEDETSEEDDDSSSSSYSSDSGSYSSSSSASFNSEHEPDSPDASPLPASKRARSEAPTRNAGVPAPDLNNDQRLLTILAEMAKPCCERLKKLKRSGGVGLKVRHHNQLVDDLKLLETAASPVALLAAALNIITTLADIQSDRFRGDAVLVRCSEAERLCNMAAQASEFAMGVRELLKDAHTSADPQ
tara:strand:- start:8115 stop:9896 length:1782 start_codon:yes stop_codon:yes gene_type:complete